ncbi:MAG: NAD(P)H-dependent oxidoreductase subunit E [Anaerolineales bacterium]|jgi:NADH:ubiquinone oxidoreductase subunit E|nr:NAD(P)H-dependent oxidoreductase subunit E [Anaerolineales bacterium]
MTRLLKNIAPNDPLNIAAQKAIIEKAIADNKDRQGAVMLVLNEVQGKIGHISPAMQAYIARKLNVPLGQVHGVVTFYSFFKTEPRGKHTIKFCLGTACYVAGVPQLVEKAKQSLGIDLGQTTPDGMITLEECRCVGACSQAPVVVIDNEIHGRAKPNKLPQLIKKIQNQEEAAKKA